MNEVPAEAAFEILIEAFQMNESVAKKIIESAKAFVPGSLVDKKNDREEIDLNRLLKKLGFKKVKLSERKKDESFDDCVARKIKILIDEGKDKDQAVAIANSVCEL